MSRDQIHTIVQSAIIAALYFLLTWAFAPISFSGVQVRISEALYAFCLFTPCGIWGMSAGCLLANLFFSPYGFLDILLGTLATFVGAIGVYALRKNKMVAFACPVISNAFLVPVVLQVAAGLQLLRTLPGGDVFSVVSAAASRLDIARLLNQSLHSYTPFW